MNNKYLYLLSVSQWFIDGLPMLLCVPPGSDIMMQLDDVVSSTVTGPRVEEAMHRSIRWLDRCISANKNREKQNLFAIIQGGLNTELRKACLDGNKILHCCDPFIFFWFSTSVFVYLVMMLEDGICIFRGGLCWNGSTIQLFEIIWKGALLLNYLYKWMYISFNMFISWKSLCGSYKWQHHEVKSNHIFPI